jgi:hypothetical protein
VVCVCGVCVCVCVVCVCVCVCVCARARAHLCQLEFGVCKSTQVSRSSSEFHVTVNSPGLRTANGAEMPLPLGLAACCVCYPCWLPSVWCPVCGEVSGEASRVCLPCVPQFPAHPGSLHVSGTLDGECVGRT